MKTDLTVVRAVLLVMLLLTGLQGCGGGGGSGGDSGNGASGDSGGNSGGSGGISGVELEITALNVPANANAGDSVPVSVSLRNNGDQTALLFDVMVLLSFDATISQSEDMLRWLDVTSLAPGATTTVNATVTLPDNLRTATFHVGVIADSSGIYDETDEADNLAMAALDVTGGSCSVDGYEEDDSAMAANVLTLNAPQQHNHCDDDADWFVFNAVQNMTYSLSTNTLGAQADTLIELYAGDATTLLGGDNDSGAEDGASQMAWTAPASGNYYVRVRTPFWLETTGPDTGYTLSLGEPISDLGIIDASVNGSTDLVAGQLQWIIFTVYNNGFLASGPFQVKAYLSTDSAIETTDTVIGSWTVDDLAPVATEQLFNVNIAIPKNTPSGTYYLGLVADPGNTVAEFNELNNIASVAQLEISAASCALDGYEDDDSAPYATAAVFGEVQQHNFCDDEDDWLAFDALQGGSYVIETVSQGADANITVYDTDGETALDGAGWNVIGIGGATLTFVAPETGTYFAVGKTHRANTGAGTDYTIRVLDDLPDLVVDFLSYEPQPFYPGGVIRAWPSTRNEGFEDAGASTTALYLSTDAVIDGSDTRLGSRMSSGIASFTTDAGWVIVPIPDSVATGDYYLGAIADDLDQVMEIYEDNNTLATMTLLTLTTPSCSADSHEQDDVISAAGSIAAGASQSRNFCEDVYDWMKIDAAPGDAYMFTAAGSTDVSFDLYDSDGTTALAQDLRDHLYWEAPAAGTYYILASRTFNSNPGSNTDYTLNVYDCDKDAYEHDDTRSVAPVITVGEAQARNHCDDGIDSVAFTALAGTAYTITTSGLGVNADTELALYNDSTTILTLAENDDEKPNVKSSKITWTAPSSGTYYVEITGKVLGSGTGYSLMLQ